jgi:hypothetical protein
MLARGFTVALMVELVRAGLASATPERIEIAQVRITEAGRQTLVGRSC